MNTVGRIREAFLYVDHIWHRILAGSRSAPKPNVDEVTTANTSLDAQLKPFLIDCRVNLIKCEEPFVRHCQFDSEKPDFIHDQRTRLSPDKEAYDMTKTSKCTYPK